MHLSNPENIMDSHRSRKSRKQAFSPLLICWLVAVAILMLVSRQGNSSPEKTPSLSSPKPSVAVSATSNPVLTAR